MGRARGGVAAAASASRRRYTEKSLRHELELYTTKREDWPTYEELRAAGRRDLAHAISINGGPVRWARELGKTLNSEQTKKQRVWTDEAIERELRTLVEGKDAYPTRAEFRAAGRYELYMAVRRYGGIEHWRKRMGLPASKRTSWSDAELEAALRQFVGDRPDWPSQEEFKRSGAVHLLGAMRRRGGGALWPRRLGKTLSDRQSSRLLDATQ